MIDYAYGTPPAHRLYTDRIMFLSHSIIALAMAYVLPALFLSAPDMMWFMFCAVVLWFSTVGLADIIREDRFGR